MTDLPSNAEAFSLPLNEINSADGGREGWRPVLSWWLSICILQAGTVADSSPYPVCATCVFYRFFPHGLTYLPVHYSWQCTEVWSLRVLRSHWSSRPTCYWQNQRDRPWPTTCRSIRKDTLECSHWPWLCLSSSTHMQRYSSSSSSSSRMPNDVCR